MRHLIFIILSFLFINNSYAGIVNENSKKWMKIDDSLFIDTKSFNIEPPLMFFWIKNQNYGQRRLTINCSTFEERERYKQLKTEWGPIISKSPKFKILNQLCYLANIEDFTKEIRPPSWAKNIIKNYEKKLLAIEELNETINPEVVEGSKSRSFID